MNCFCPVNWLHSTVDGYLRCVNCKKTYRLQEVTFNSDTKKIEDVPNE